MELKTTIEIVGCIIGLILIAIHIESIIKKIEGVAPLSLFQITKYALLFLLIGLFVCSSLVLILKEDFNLHTFETVAHYNLFHLISVALVLTVEGNREKGDKELSKEKEESIFNIVRNLMGR